MTPEEFTIMVIGSLADLRAAAWMVAASTGAVAVAVLLHTVAVLVLARRRQRR